MLRFPHTWILTTDLPQDHFKALKEAYPGRHLLIVSNTAGALSHDPKRRLASAVEEATGVNVLSHQTKKPGCGPEIMEYFRQHPETGVTSPCHIAVVGDRLSTDMMLSNMMGSYGVWVKDGVVPLRQKSLVSKSLRMLGIPATLTCGFQFSRLEQRLGPYLLSRGHTALQPRSPFE